MVTLRTLHAKNQPPSPKTVAYGLRTDRRTHRQTEKANSEDPFIDFFCFVFDYQNKLKKGDVNSSPP